MKKVLVLGNDSRIFLSVVRSLGRAGIQVHGAWQQPETICLRSRYLFKAHTLPPFHSGNHDWRDAVAALMEQEHFDLVLPCTDAETVACQHHRAELEKLGRVYLISEKAYRLLFDKLQSTALARDVGVTTARELVVTSVEQSREILDSFDFPVVLKPQRSSDLDCPGAFHKVSKAYDAEQLGHLLPPMLAVGPVAVQENFIGRGVGVELLLQRGEVLLAFQHVRIHEPLQGGPGSYRKSVPLSPQLLEAALKLLRPLDYTGVAMVEFKVNPQTGAWIFIEVNARFWGSLPLTVAAGANFPLALFQFLVEGRTRFPRHYRQGIYCRNLSRDFEWQQLNFFADHADATLSTRPVARVLRDAVVNSLTFRERNDTLTLDDPLPGLTEILEVAQRLGGRATRPLRSLMRAVSR